VNDWHVGFLDGVIAMVVFCFGVGALMVLWEAIDERRRRLESLETEPGAKTPSVKLAHCLRRE